MEAAVAAQRLFHAKRRAWAAWRNKLDEERLVWWELDKHACIQGKFVRKRRVWRRLVEGVRMAREGRIEDEAVARKMAEVQGWLQEDGKN